MASSRTVPYLLPGGQTAESFHHMCSIYMDKYFPEWIHAAETNVLPPLPRCSPEPPIGVSGGSRRADTTEKNFKNFRTKQKSDLDELLLIRQLQKYSEEHQSRMFAFHQLCFNTKEWQWFESILKAEGKMQHWASLRGCFEFDERWKLPKNFEIDLITVDDRSGVTVWEVKGRNFWCEQQQGYARIHNAAQQLKRDVDFLTWLARTLYEPTYDSDRELAIRKVVVLPDDHISENESAAFQNLRDYSVLTSDKLRSYDEFSAWCQRSFAVPVTQHSLYHYQQLVPLLVGLISTAGAVGLVRQADKESHVARVLQPSAAVAELDEEIQREQLARTGTEQLHTDLERTQKTDVFRTAKSIKILFLTPSQQAVYRDGVEGLTVLEGPAGAGKSILTAFKVLELARKRNNAPIMLLCRGAYAWHYKQLLSDNGLESQMAVPIVTNEKTASSWFRKFLQCDLVETDDRLKITLHVTVKDAILPQVCIGQATDFGDAFRSLIKQATFKYRVSKKIRQDELSSFEVSVIWEQKMHLIIDDADLSEISNCKEIMTQASAELTTWIALDHAQILAGCFLSDTVQNLLQQVSELASGVKWHKLLEVLRNSVEIFEFNRHIAAYITKRLSKGADQPASSLQGTNLHGPLVYIYELYESSAQEERMLQSNFAPGTQVMTEFVLFVFDKILDQNAQSQNVPILAAGLDPVLQQVAITLETREHRKMVGADLKSQYETEEFAAADVTVDGSPTTKSFEWERSLVVAPWPVGAHFGRQDAESVCSVALGSFQALYQATTRPRSQLYIVAPGDYFAKWLRTIGVPDSCVILNKYRKSESGDFVNDPNAEMPLEKE